MVILGEGLCGLSAAYHLEEKGKTDYLIVERECEVGGLARTVTCDGFSFDYAIHILFSNDPYASALICNKLLTDNTRRQIRKSFCYSSGVYTEYPYQANNYGLPPAVIAENIMGLINLCGKGVPSAVVTATQGLKGNGVHAVNIGLTGNDFSTTEMMHWIYFPEEATIFHRVGFPGNFSPRMVPSGRDSFSRRAMLAIKGFFKPMTLIISVFAWRYLWYTITGFPEKTD